MKTIRSYQSVKLAALSLLSGATFISCSNDDPEPVNESEIITTLTVTLTPMGGGEAVTLQFQDADGEGPGAPQITVSGDLAAGTTYTGAVTLLNETATPIEDITEEVAAEKDEHQFFFQPSAGLQLTPSYQDQDSNGYPVGLSFQLLTGAASSGTLTVTLVHEPDKAAPGVEAGDRANAGGETDIEVSFEVVVM